MIRVEYKLRAFLVYPIFALFFRKHQKAKREATAAMAVTEAKRLLVAASPSIFYFFM